MNILYNTAMSLEEAFELLNNLNEGLTEDNANDMPAEVAEMIKDGVPLLSELPTFLKDELSGISEAFALSESDISSDGMMADNCRWPSAITLYKHYNSHVLGSEDKSPIEFINSENFNYKFSNSYDKATYTALAADLANAEIDNKTVFGFICQDTRREGDGDHTATLKTASGEARLNRHSKFRICKFRLNKNIYLDSQDVYSKEHTVISDDYRYVFADHDIVEIVFYSFSHRLRDRATDIIRPTKILLSYFLKRKTRAQQDIANATRAYDDGTTLRRFANNLDIEKAAVGASRQPVVMVLSFVTDRSNCPGRLCIKIDYYNDMAVAQEAYAKNMHAFLVILFNGTTYYSLKGKLKPEPDHASNLIYLANNIVHFGDYFTSASLYANPRIEQIAIWVQSLCQSVDLSGAISDADFINFLNEVTDNAEYKAKRTGLKSLYMADVSNNTPLLLSIIAYI